MKELKDGIRALVRLDFEGNVHKHFRGTDADKRCANEVKVLQELEARNCPNVPRLLSFDLDENIIVTTSCGAPAPSISKKKADALFHELEHNYGIRHDDPEPRNITYSAKMGAFCIIDFELAEILPLPECTEGEDPDCRQVWKAAWHALTSQGKNHPANDDAYLIFEITPKGTRSLESAGEDLLDPAHLLLAVSDGMGGRNAGEFASRLIMSWIRRHASEHYQALEAGDTAPLADLLQSAHEGLNKLASEDEKLAGMGATFTLAWITSKQLHLAHIGDSRLYLLDREKGAVNQLSKEHTLAWGQWKRGEITEHQYRAHPRRAALYEALGGGHPRITPHIASFDIHSGDRLLICSDGLIDGLYDRHIKEALAEKKPPREIAPYLLKRSNDNDNTDDTTLIIADLVKL
ncbi:MAG: protein phosphatase 2C domain-containing protein [Verrucomicrobiales bacterium]